MRPLTHRPFDRRLRVCGVTVTAAESGPTGTLEALRMMTVLSPALQIIANPEPDGSKAMSAGSFPAGIVSIGDTSTRVGGIMTPGSKTEAPAMIVSE